MNVLSLRSGALLVATCSLVLGTACGASTGGGGGGVAAPKDTTSTGDTTGTASDTSVVGDTSPGDTVAQKDIDLGGTDIISVEIVDKPDAKPDVTKTDTSKPDASKPDTTVGTSCVTTSGCDPISNDCANTGEACDVDTTGATGCFPPPNDVALGGKCDNQAGPFCVGGYHCGQNGTCQKMCCSNADCNSGQTCTPFGIVATDTLGVCDP